MLRHDELKKLPTVEMSIDNLSKLRNTDYVKVGDTYYAIRNLGEIKPYMTYSFEDGMMHRHIRRNCELFNLTYTYSGSFFMYTLVSKNKDFEIVFTTLKAQSIYKEVV